MQDELVRAEAAAPPKQTRPRPHFSADIQPLAMSLPPGKRLGSAVGIARAANGDLFLLQDVVWGNPKLAEEEQLLPIVHLSADGTFIAAWGGPGQLPSIDGVSQWPTGPDN